MTLLTISVEGVSPVRFFVCRKIICPAITLFLHTNICLDRAMVFYHLKFLKLKRRMFVGLLLWFVDFKHCIWALNQCFNDVFVEKESAVTSLRFKTGCAFTDTLNQAAALLIKKVTSFCPGDA